MTKLTFKDYSQWLKNHWLKVGIIVGLYFALATLMLSSKLDSLGILIFLAMPLYVVHEIEDRNFESVQKKGEKCGKRFTLKKSTVVL